MFIPIFSLLFLQFKDFSLVASKVPGIGNTLTVTGFNLKDPDHNVDPIRMDVTASNNLLVSLNPKFLLPITSDCIFSSWGCVGDGVASEIFIGVGTIWCRSLISFFHLTKMTVICIADMKILNR